MDRPHQPNVIRTWTVERTRHPIRETPSGVPARMRKQTFHPENRPRKTDPPRKTA